MDLAKINLDNLILCKAELSDYARVMEISEGVYEGHDYLPHCYKIWMEQGKMEPLRRINLLLVYSTPEYPRLILGFKSYQFQVVL